MKRKQKIDSEGDHIDLSDRENHELSRFETELMSFSNIKVKFPQKDAVKKHLMARIEEREKEKLPYRLKVLVNKIRRVAGGVQTPAWAKIMMKERILDYAESTRSWRFAEIGGGFNGLYRKLSAATLLVVFAFTIVMVFPMKPPVTYAKSTYLDAVEGDVFIKRKVEKIKAEPKMFVEEGDTIITEGSSTATIRFLDDSISRMSENSSVEVKILYSEPSNSVSTRVELYLEEGRMWSKVVNLMEDSSFSVDTEDLRADVGSKAAFDISVEGDTTEVVVFENVVEVVPTKDKLEPPKTVIAGYKAEVGDSDLDNITLEKLPRNEILMPQSDWVALNLDSDEDYDESLIEDKENTVEGGDKVIEVKTRVLTLPVAKEKKEYFLEAYEVLTGAQAKLVADEQEVGLKDLKRFSAMTEEVIAYLPELKEEDPFAEEALRALMKENVSMQLKDLASFLPGDKLYKVKETLQEIEVKLGATEVQRAEIRLKQAGSILLEIESLIAKNQPHLASSLLKRYQNRTNNITLRLTTDNIAEVKERFVPIIQGQAEHMKMLTAIENSIIYLDHNDIKVKVTDVRKDTLRKFVTALEQMPEAVPDDVIYEVKDLYETYVDGDDAETDMIEPAYDKVSDNQKQGVTFIDPTSEEVPNEMGIFMMVPLEGSADVNTVNSIPE